MAEKSITSAYDGLKLPYSTEAEQSVLGAILLDPACLDRVAELLPRPDYFHLTNHQAIYGAMLDMFTVGKIVDFVTVNERLKQEGTFEGPEAKAYLMQLAEIVPAISNVEVYAKIVRDKYEVRSLIMAARDIIEEASDGSYESETLLDSAEQKIFDIRRGKICRACKSLTRSL